MASRLASAMLQVPRSDTAVGDVLWRQAEIHSVPFAGCAPSDALFAEFSAILAGDTATNFAAIVPDSTQLATLVASPQQAFRLGAVRNPLLTDSQLAALCADKTAAVREAAQEAADKRAQARAAAAAAEPSCEELVSLPDLEGIRAQLSSAPDVIVEGLLRSSKRNDLLDVLEVIDHRLFDELLLAWTTAEGTPLDVRAARWLCATEVRQDTLVAPLASQSLRRRSTPAAQEVFIEHGLLTAMKPSGPAGPAYASLEALMLVLPVNELAGMLVGSDSPVETATADRILLTAPSQLVANYLAGSCLRKPRPGDVSRLVAAATPDRRAEWGELLVKAGQDVDSLTGRPWAGELLLLATMDWLSKLDAVGLGALDDVLCERLGDVTAAWELAMVLSEEWETTLYDLLDTATAMEDQTV